MTIKFTIPYTTRKYLANSPFTLSVSVNAAMTLVMLL